MPEPGFTVTSDGVIEAFAAKLAVAPEWMPQIYGRHMPKLGETVGEVMNTLLEVNRYTGTLQEAITSEYDLTEQAVRIFSGVPYAARLETGSGPIPNAPWAPIKAWADFRGIPAYPVWWKIRTIGVAPHPYLQRTLEDLRTQTAMTDTAARIVADMAIELAAAAHVGTAAA